MLVFFLGFFTSARSEGTGHEQHLLKLQRFMQQEARVTPRCFETIPWKTGFASVFFGNTCIKGQPLLKYWSNLYSRKIKQSKTCHNMTRGFSYVMLRATGDAGCEREHRTSCFLRMTYGKAFAGRAAEDKNNLKRAGSTRVQPVQAEFLTE